MRVASRLREWLKSNLKFDGQRLRAAPKDGPHVHGFVPHRLPRQVLHLVTQVVNRS